jgi:flagellar biosynthesis protein FlhG
MPVLIAIASGKGGVGKSFISANLAYAFSESINKTLLVDCDLGGANLQHFLWIPPPKENLYPFLREKSDFNKLIIPVKNNLELMSGNSDVLGMIHIKNYEKNKLIRNINAVDYSYVIIDLGAGSSYNTLDIFNASDLKILIITPEQTSLENAYGFLKMAYLRGILDIVKNDKILAFLSKQISFKSGGIKNISYIKEILSKEDNKYIGLIDEFTQKYRIGIILNMVQQKNELSFLVLLSFIVKKYLGFHIEKIGFFPYDTTISKALKEGAIYYNVTSNENRECFLDILNKINRLNVH